MIYKDTVLEYKLINPQINQYFTAKIRYKPVAPYLYYEDIPVTFTKEKGKTLIHIGEITYEGRDGLAEELQEIIDIRNKDYIKIRGRLRRAMKNGLTLYDRQKAAEDYEIYMNKTMAGYMPVDR